MNLSEKIKKHALKIGFDLVGITTADPISPDQRDSYNKWLREGRAAGMAYLHRHNDKRFNPAALLKNAQSVICVAVNYKMQVPVNTDFKIASFALYEDYHSAIKQGLFELAAYIRSIATQDVFFKACVDSIPLSERALAQRAGLGFIGRNRMLIHPKLGNQLLLGELLTTLPLECDTEMVHDGCKDCQKCIRSCPSGALSNGDFDACRCISYLTIEEKGNLPIDCLDKFSHYVFGCDECLNACPYSQVGPVSSSPLLKARPEWLTVNRRDILDMTPEQFETFFAGSGIIRLGLERLKRNCRCI